MNSVADAVVAGNFLLLVVDASGGADGVGVFVVVVVRGRSTQASNNLSVYRSAGLFVRRFMCRLQLA